MEQQLQTPPGGAPPGADVAVYVRGLTKTYHSGPTSVEALKGVNLTIKQGEFVAVMGPSGSGKSTLMHILGALENATSGEVTIGGQSIVGLDDKRLTLLRRDAIGFIFQFFNLLPTLTAEENVMLPSLIAGESAGKLRKHAHELLDLVGLSERREHLPSQLSGGEQQRVSVARSLMRDPDLLLADEPTGNLDPTTSTSVFDNLYNLARRQGIAAVVATHNLELARHMDRVLTLRDGHLEPHTF